MNDAATTTMDLARFVVNTRVGQIPDVVLHQGKRCIINMLAVALHAMQDPALQMLLDVFAAEGGARRASVLGAGFKTSLQNAAMANGLLAHLDDYDDTFFPTVLHPSAPTIPVALALAEQGRLTGRDFLVASLLGLEATCRVALAIQNMRHGAVWHMTGTAGVFGGAAAAGRLLGMDVVHMACTFGLAGTQASGLRETFGTMTKAFHPARAAHSGLLAALLVQQGFTSSTTILEGRHGFAAAFAPNDADLKCIADDLGVRWEVMNNAPKPYASAILSHPLVDGMLALRQQPGVAPEHIISIRCRVNPLTIKLESRPEPATGLEGRLSFQHAMTVALVDGACFPAQFTDARVHDPVVAGLRRKIQVEGDAAIAQDQCELTLTLADGSTHTEWVAHATGSPANPVTDAQLDAKFRVLAGSVLPKVRVARLLDTLWTLERVTDVADIVVLCRAPARRR
ncbi:MAG: MmgE/PrpD family protein [Betaproteobacteria bacterium]|nr:MAG: MmgE/PrpD family protein [Betaproteobacteria bacterium]